MFSHGLHSSCSIFSHGIRGIHRTFLLYILPQIAQIFTDAAFKGVHLSQVHQPSKRCTNRAKLYKLNN